MIARRATVIAVLGLALLAPGTTALGPLQFYSVTPCRLLDTRDPIGPTGGPFLSNGVQRNFPVIGSLARFCGISSEAKAVSVNAAIVTPTGIGYVKLWANNAPFPGTSNINFGTGQSVIANGALVKLTYGPDDNLVDPTHQIAAWASITDGATAHLILDITGYYR